MPSYLGGGGGDARTSIDGDITVSSEVEVKNDTGNPIPTVQGLSIPAHGHVALSYTGANLTGVTYKVDASGATVATLALAYDASGNLTSVTKS